MKTNIGYENELLSASVRGEKVMNMRDILNGY